MCGYVSPTDVSSCFSFFYPHALADIGKVLIYRLLFFCILCVCVSTVTNISGRVVQGRPGQGISHVGNFAPPEA